MRPNRLVNAGREKNQIMNTAKKRVTIVGERGTVSQLLRARLAQDQTIDVRVISTANALVASTLPGSEKADLLVLCVLDFASPKLVGKLSSDARVLDVSPEFRTASGWVYGLAELPGQAEAIRSARLVANPGCFATAATLAIAPLVRAKLLSPDAPLYLDAVGGYTTGGAALVEKEASGELPAESVFSLTRPHRHIEEIRKYAGLTGPVWFTPKVARFPRGIRLQVPLFGVDPAQALSAFQNEYRATDIVVETTLPSKIVGNEWAERPGACLRVFPQTEGCLVVCQMDNLGKGAVDSAYQNIKLMLAH